MNENQASTSALISAYGRAYHSMHDVPKIFDDFLASHLFTEDEHKLFSQNLAESLKFFDPESSALCIGQPSALAKVMRVQIAPITLSRAQHTETSLEAAVKQGVRQYVILGAGLDTFAFRRPDLLKELQVFEVDHPATQAYKQKRITELGWKIPEQLHFIPVDFTKDSLVSALKHTAYNPDRLSFFSWLGVTYYLTREEVFSTLADIVNIAPSGSSIIFDYMDNDALIPEKTSRRVQLMQVATSRSGEPMKAGFDPLMFSGDLVKIGLRLVENLNPSDIEERYFSGRADGYHAFENVHFAWAIVA